MSHLLKVPALFLATTFLGLLAQLLAAAESKKLLKDTPFEEVVAKAKAGDGEAQLYLAKGHALTIGGVPYNKQESHRWYLAAATNGLVEAELYLGNHYYQEALANRGVAAKDKAARNQNATASLSWNLKAAKQGSFEAWRRLGIAFDEGRVYAKDPVEAYKWYHLAIEKGGNKILAPTQQRNALSLKLTPAQIELAKRRALDFWDSLGEEKKPTAPK